MHWIKFVLLVSVVGLGAGSFLAIGLANRAAEGSFEQFARTVAGQSHAVVTPALGDLSLADLRGIRKALLDSEAALVPQLVSTASLRNRADVSPEDSTFTLVGIDLMAASNLLVREGAERTFFDAELSESTFGRPESGFAQGPTLEAFGWSAERSVELYLEDRVVELPGVLALPELEDRREAAANVIVLDWELLAELLQKPLHAARVDLVWPDGEPTATQLSDALAAIEAANPGHWVVESQVQRQSTGATMTLALRMNLRALSALSLLVAIFLVFQSLDSAVARRQAEVAVLHSLGVSSKQTRLLWLIDSAFIGLVGGGVGVALGYVLAFGSTHLVTQTVNTLYYPTGEASVAMSLSEAGLAWGLTAALCVLAGWWPARQASRSPLIETMKQAGNRSTYSRFAYVLAAIACGALSFGSLFVPPIDAANGHSVPVGGYLLALSLIGMVASLGCLALEGFGALAGAVGSKWVSLRLALSQFRKPVTRHRLALSGVVISVGMTASMIFLIGSFDATVRAWISSTLQADLFLRPRAAGTALDAPLISKATVEALRNDNRVADIGLIQSESLRIQGLTTQLLGYDVDYLKRIDHLTWISRPGDLLELRNSNGAVVNESFAHRFSKWVGDEVVVPYAGGVARFRIAGVLADYGNENGSLGVDLSRFFELTGEGRPRAVALHLEEGVELEALAQQLRADYPGLSVVSNRWLREESLKIFNRVFSITYALEAIGLLISVVGLGSMLASLLLERRSETSALSRMGFGPSKVARSCLWEGVSLAFLGILGGLVLGFVLGLVLVFIINRQSFGWTLTVSTPWTMWVWLAGLCMFGAGAVSYFVGRWSANLPVIHEE